MKQRGKINIPDWLQYVLIVLFCIAFILLVYHFLLATAPGVRTIHNVNNDL